MCKSWIETLARGWALVATPRNVETPLGGRRWIPADLRTAMTAERIDAAGMAQTGRRPTGVIASRDDGAV